VADPTTLVVVGAAAVLGWALLTHRHTFVPRVPALMFFFACRWGVAEPTTLVVVGAAAVLGYDSYQPTVEPHIHALTFLCAGGEWLIPPRWWWLVLLLCWALRAVRR
jgi:hypothetical protein